MLWTESHCTNNLFSPGTATSTTQKGFVGYLCEDSKSAFSRRFHEEEEENIYSEVTLLGGLLFRRINPTSHLVHLILVISVKVVARIATSLQSLRLTPAQDATLDSRWQRVVDDDYEDSAHYVGDPHLSQEQPCLEREYNVTLTECWPRPNLQLYS